ncbi:uncharacterized protein RJT20DRAFT_119688 [Scheffersomyces xylosifermentans]|uniref:uncharacterized protein n=1 Tax=Scheffersomyces xylosifermentans TaxID=1304137 RepID=UPI00315DC118
MSDLSNKLGPQGRALIYRANPSGENVSSTTPYSSNSKYPQATPQELDFLINDMRFPKKDSSIQKILGYMYHYVPYIKHEHNLRLIIASFLNNPLCFGQEANAPFEENYAIIEVFKLITDKKLKISQPTLPIKTFYSVILKELTNFVSFNPQVNSWKVLPILSGLFLSNELRDQLYMIPNFIEYQWFFSDWDRDSTALFRKALGFSLAPSYPDNIVNLSLLSYAITYKKDEKVKDYTSGIAHSFIISKLVDLLCLHPTSSVAVLFKFFHINPNDPESENIVQKEISQKPVIKHMNRLSFLLESYYKTLEYDRRYFDLIMRDLVKIRDLNRAFTHSTQNSAFNNPSSTTDHNPVHRQFWYYMKGLLFAEILVFQGILTRFMSATSGFAIFNPFRRHHLMEVESQYKEISLSILNSLYYLNFTLLSIGQGGFDSYNFVYYLSTELALNSGVGFENLTKTMIGDYREINLYPDVLNANYVMRAKVLFVLGLWENYLQSKKTNDVFIKEFMFDLCVSLADDRKYSDNDIIEAGHSVLLFSFSNSSSYRIEDCAEYIELLLRQFPSRISAQQLSIAIETLGKKLLSTPVQYINAPHRDSAEQFIAHLYSDNNVVAANSARKPKNLVSLDPLPAIAGKIAPEYEFENRLIPETSREALILTIINLIPYLPLSTFTSWLDKIQLAIGASMPGEAQFLTKMLWKSLSENLDLNRVELGIRWWYDVQGLPQQEQVVQKKLEHMTLEEKQL